MVSITIMFFANSTEKIIPYSYKFLIKIKTRYNRECRQIWRTGSKLGDIKKSCILTPGGVADGQKTSNRFFSEKGKNEAHFLNGFGNFYQIILVDRKFNDLAVLWLTYLLIGINY